MAFASSHESRVFAGGFEYSCYSRGFSMSSTTDMLDTTTLCNPAKVFIPGQDTSTASFDIIYDAAQSSHANTWSSATALPVTYLPHNTTVGSSAFLFNSIRTEYTVTSAVAATVDATLTTVNTGVTGYGVSLSPLAAITTDTAGTSVDNGASTTGGAVAHLHTTAHTGHTVAIRIEHSTNNSTWTTLASFSTMTTTAISERIVITGTINRYVRVYDDLTGSGSTTRAVAFARL